MPTDSRRIPADVRRQADEIIRRFNETLNNPDRGYVARYRGQYLYLDRRDYGDPPNVCRLTYTGSMDRWHFAIYKYGDERYDPEEFLFLGSEHLDGTIEGAMKAGIEAYPIREMGPAMKLLRWLIRGG